MNLIRSWFDPFSFVYCNKFCFGFSIGDTPLTRHKHTRAQTYSIKISYSTLHTHHSQDRMSGSARDPYPRTTDCPTRSDIYSLSLSSPSLYSLSVSLRFMAPKLQTPNWSSSSNSNHHPPNPFNVKNQATYLSTTTLPPFLTSNLIHISNPSPSLINMTETAEVNQVDLNNSKHEGASPSKSSLAYHSSLIYLITNYSSTSSDLTSFSWEIYLNQFVTNTLPVITYANISLILIFNFNFQMNVCCSRQNRT